MRALPAGQHRHAREDRAVGHAAPERAPQRELFLDHVVREIVRQRLRRTVAGNAQRHLVVAHHDRLRAPRIEPFDPDFHRRLFDGDCVYFLLRSIK